MYYPMTKCTHKQLMTACMLAGTLMLEHVPVLPL